jgi:hypothetical protein
MNNGIISFTVTESFDSIEAQVYFVGCVSFSCIDSLEYVQDSIIDMLPHLNEINIEDFKKYIKGYSSNDLESFVVVKLWI